MSYFFNTIIEHNRKCEPREGGSQSHPDCSRVDKGDADLDGDPAAGEPAAEEHGRSQLVGERRCDTAAEVPHGTLQGHHRSNQAIKQHMSRQSLRLRRTHHLKPKSEAKGVRGLPQGEVSRRRSRGGGRARRLRCWRRWGRMGRRSGAAQGWSRWFSRRLRWAPGYSAPLPGPWWWRAGRRGGEAAPPDSDVVSCPQPRRTQLRRKEAAAVLQSVLVGVGECGIARVIGWQVGLRTES